jgi:hypothetical protein
MRATDEPKRPRLLLRDAADINRARIHLVTHWTLPRIEFRVDALPVLVSQRAQDRFVRLAEACNCLFGQLLAGATLLGGSVLTWTSRGGWREMGLVALATLYAAFIGKGIELAWNRMRLLLVLRRVRRRLGAAGQHATIESVIPVAAPRTFRHALNVDDGEVLPENLRRPRPSGGPKRPKVLLHDDADINQLVIRLATRWRLPRIEIHIDGLAELDTQRAQASYVRLSEGLSYLPAAFMATAILLGGLLYAVWTSSQDWLFSSREDWWVGSPGWSDVEGVVVATLCAALVGWVAEVVWIRVRLVMVLRGLRRLE